MNIRHGTLTHVPRYRTRRWSRPVGWLHWRGIHALCITMRVVVDEYQPPAHEFIVLKDGEQIDITNQDAVGRPSKWHHERVAG